MDWTCGRIKRKELKVIKEEHVLGQAVWYNPERVQVHRDLGVKLC